MNKLNDNAKTILARLLSAENISVEFSKKMQTAAFDPKNRVLIMPVFDNVSADVDALFLGHECGHALFTPQDSITEVNSLKKSGLKDLVNIVEDARIEKMMQKKFGGLRRSFYNAYDELFNKRFFGVGYDDVHDLSFPNRLNLHFKVGSRLGIHFSVEEQVFVDRIENADSWADVMEISNDLYEYIAQTEEENEEEEETDTLGNASEGPQSSDDNEEEKENSSDGEDEENEDSEENQQQDYSFEESEEDDEGEEEGASAGQADEGEEDDADTEDTDNTQTATDESFSGQQDESDNPIDASTQDSFDNNTKDLATDLEDEHNDVVNLKIADPILENLVITPSEVRKLIDSAIVWGKTNYQNASIADISDARELANSFKNSQNSAVNLMAKEFEMRKSAAEHQRSRVAKTGVLNPNKLHSYRFNEDIFLRQSIVEEGKNHGFIMFLDWSSSMTSSMADTISQVQLLALFCKKINVPFEVYAFSNNSNDIVSKLGCSNRRFVETQKEFEGSLKFCQGFKVFQFFKSGMKTRDFNDAFVSLEYLKQQYNSSSEKYFVPPQGMALRGTPLGEAIMAAVPLTENFKKNNGLQIVNTIFLTDGAGQLPRSSMRKTESDLWGNSWDQAYIPSHHNGVYIHDQGRVYRTSISTRFHIYNDIWNTLYQILKDRTGCNLIGFYIAPNNKRAFNREAQHLFAENWQSYEVVNETFKQMRNEGFIDISYCCFDRYILIPSTKLSLQDEELSVNSEMTKAKMAKSFIKQRKAGQTNKKMLREFVEAVA